MSSSQPDLVAFHSYRTPRGPRFIYYARTTAGWVEVTAKRWRALVDAGATRHVGDLD